MAGIGFAVPLKTKEDDFIGKEELKKRKENPQKKLVGLELIGGSLFNNSLITEQIDSRYGLLKQLRDVLLNAPVLVRLDALEGGRFQAAIQARLMLGQIDMTKQVLMPLPSPC